MLLAGGHHASPSDISRKENDHSLISEEIAHVRGGDSEPQLQAPQNRTTWNSCAQCVAESK